MTYEYLDDIKNSGIRRDAFPASCSSYMEMGMYAAVDTTRELNNIFEAAGMVELTKYKNNSLNEVNLAELKKTVIKKAKEMLTKFWEAIKAAFAKATAFLAEKLDKFAEIGKKFDSLALNNYSQALTKVFGDGDKVSTLLDINRAESLKNKLSKANYSISQDIANSKAYDKYDKPYTALIDRAIGTNIDNGSSFAKAAMEEYVAKEPKKVTYKFVISQKANIAKIIKETPKLVKKDYSDAKQAIDKAERTIEACKNDSDVKSAVMTEAQVAIAYQNCVLGLLDIRRKIFVQAMAIATKAVIACKVSADNQTKNAKAKAKEEKAAKKSSPKTESVEVAPEVDNTPDYIKEAFNW